MAIHTIEKNMLVQTSIEMQPDIVYIDASLYSGSFLERLDIPLNESGEKVSGVYGSIKSKNLETFKDNTVNVYTLNNRFFTVMEENQSNLLQEIERIKNSSEELNAAVSQRIDDLPTENITFSLSEQNYLDKLTASSKLIFDKRHLSQNGIKKTENIFDFKTERVDKLFMIDNPSYLKKKSIMNMYNFYKENIEYNNFYDLEWGFKNFNSLNFFNIYDDFNDNFKNDITHSNCLLYPNFKENNELTYDFNSTDELTFSFFINPKRAVSKDFHYNPGCVINVPNVCSIYIVKGSSLNALAEPDKFRIFCEIGNDTSNSIESNFSSFNINNSSLQQNNFCFLTSDNILSLNNWHNVCVSLKQSNAGNINNTEVFVYVDGVLIDMFNFVNKQVSLVQDSSFISIGNKINIENNLKSDFMLHCFSKDDKQVDDNEGPYVKKFISYGNRIESVLNTGSNPSQTYTFRNKINSSNSGYITSDTSMALNAEIHDIRIYKNFFDKEKSKTIFYEGISNKNKEITEEKLIFYIPVYYKSQKIKKRGLVNLNAPYQKSFGQPVTGSFAGFFFGTVDEYLEGNYRDASGNDIDNIVGAENDFKVKTSNISYDFPINPYFLNFTGGTDVSVEHFVSEFVQSSYPNIVIGGNIKEDRYQDCFLGKASIILNDALFNNISKKGNVPFAIYEEIVKNLTEKDVNSLSIDYQSNNISYRNYMIFPNDNGIQNQYYNKENFDYDESQRVICHVDSHNNEDISFVSLKNIDKYFQKNTNIPARSLIIQDIIDENENRVKEPEDRNTYTFQNKVLSFLGQIEPDIEPFFNEECDKIKNISLSNYHDDVKSSFIHQYDIEKVTLSSTGRFTSNVGSEGNRERVITSLHNRTDFYRTFSNPANRSYYSEFENTISLSEICDTKQIEDQSSIVYKKMILPLSNLDNEFNENCVTIFAISNQIFNNKIKRTSFTIKDADLSLSSGLNLSFSDTILGSLYRSDSLTKHANWNTSGNILYKEGVSVITHPSMFNFGKTNFQINAKCHASKNIFELNLPATAGKTNKSFNDSYKENLKLDASAFNEDEDFVYITDIDLHDENLNVVASAKLAQPFAKKSSDNILFRIKMDF